MKMRALMIGLWRSLKEQPTEGFFLAASFFVPLSLPLGRLFIALAFFSCLVDAYRKRRRLVLPVSFLFALGLFVVLIYATFNGINPEHGVRRLTKLFWFIALPSAAFVVASRTRLGSFLMAYGAGSAARAVLVLVRNPLQARAKLVDYPDISFSQALIDIGTITDGQRLMLGLIVAVLLLFYRLEQKRVRSAWRWGVALFLIFAAEVITFKRGSWLVALIVLGYILLRQWRWYWVLALALVLAGGIFAMPAARSRMLDIGKEWDPDSGGRMHLWVHVAPRFIAKYPGGVGFRSLTGADLRQASELLMHLHRHRKWVDQNHMHSNPIQLLVAGGWLGLALYLLWMGAGIVDGIRTARITAPFPGGSTLGIAPLALLAALLLNGLVEYNFAKAELVLVLGLVLGVGGRLAIELRRDPAAAWDGEIVA